jgi:hypothetical protein
VGRDKPWSSALSELLGRQAWSEAWAAVRDAASVGGYRSSPARTRSTTGEPGVESADPSTGLSSLSGLGGLAGVEGAGILVGGGALALTEPTSGPWE